MPINIDLEEVDDKRLAKVAFNTFFNIVERWSLTEETIIILLGNPRSSQFEIWKKGGALEIDSSTLTRVSLVIGIYKALHSLFEDSEQADTWLHRPNQMFENKPALISLCSGELEEMYALRRYLDNQIY
tara:strand:- start:1954 stop:2340 length:387 start_codon:yes stop_codon:yes gene_type:complete